MAGNLVKRLTYFSFIAILLAAFSCKDRLDYKWKKIYSSGNFSHIKVKCLQDSRLLVFVDNVSSENLLYSEDAGDHFIDLGYKGHFSNVLAYDKKKNQIYTGGLKETILYRYDFRKKRWQVFSRPHGTLNHIEVSRTRLYVLVNSTLYYAKLSNHLKFRPVYSEVSNFAIFQRKKKKPETIFLTGKDWFWVPYNFRKKSWRNVTPGLAKEDSLVIASPASCNLSVFQDGTWFRSDDCKEFSEHPVGLFDIVGVSIDPSDKKKMVIATRGSGIYETQNHGISFRYLGLKSQNVFSFDLDRKTKTLYIGTSNLLLDNHVFRLKLK